MFLAIEQDVRSSYAFDFASPEDATDRTYQNIVLRRGQSAFRKELLEAYHGRRAFTGYNSEFALKACHIIPYRRPDTNHVSKGLLLLSDIHTLFDLGKLAVDKSEMTVTLVGGIARSSYPK